MGFASSGCRDERWADVYAIVRPSGVFSACTNFIVSVEREGQILHKAYVVEDVELNDSHVDVYRFTLNLLVQQLDEELDRLDGLYD